MWLPNVGYKSPQKKEEMRHPLAFLAEGKSYLSFGVDLNIFCTSTESWDLWVDQEEQLFCRPSHPFCHSRECLEGTSDKGGLSKKSPFQWGLNTLHTHTRSACHWITSPEIFPTLFLSSRSRGRQFKKVVQVRTVFNRFWSKGNWSTKDFSCRLNLELHSGLKPQKCNVSVLLQI